jgi:rhodanese-related sulfurtransferase
MLDGPEDFVLLDIRFGLLARQHYVNTPRRINIPLDMLIDRLGELEQGKKVVVLGEIGERSSIAARYLNLKGFEDISYVEGGMKRWMDEGLPVKKR